MYRDKHCVLKIDIQYRMWKLFLALYSWFLSHLLLFHNAPPPSYFSHPSSDLYWLAKRWCWICPDGDGLFSISLLCQHVSSYLRDFLGKKHNSPLTLFLVWLIVSQIRPRHIRFTVFCRRRNQHLRGEIDCLALWRLSLEVFTDSRKTKIGLINVWLSRNEFLWFQSH